MFCATVVSYNKCAFSQVIYSIAKHLICGSFSLRCPNCICRLKMKQNKNKRGTALITSVSVVNFHIIQQFVQTDVFLSP